MALPVPDPATAARQAAVLTKATFRAAALLGLNHAAVARIIGVSPATVSRLASGERSLDPGTKPAELAALLVRVYRSLDALVGNSDEHRRIWMTSHNEAFGQAPRDAMLSVEGLALVVRYLDGARAPV